VVAEDMADTSSLDEIVRRIAEVAGPDRVILFGSHARGDARPNSDYDLLIVGPSELPRWRRTVALYAALSGVEAPYDLVWYTQAELDDWAGVRSHFATTAQREGQVLYEKPR